MQQISIDQLLMVLSLTLTSPENYIQLNSQNADLSEYLRIDDGSILHKNCGVPEMSNLSSVIDTLISNQLKISERTKQIELDLQALTRQSSTSTNANGCTKQKVGVTNMKLPIWPLVFPVRCVSNQYGDNWLMVAHKNANSRIFGKTSSLQSYANSVGDMNAEYFIGFKILRAITDYELYELLIIVTNNSVGSGQQWYDYYDAVAFDDNNKVKLLGQYRTNRSGGGGGGDVFNGLTAQAKAVNEKFEVNSNAEITIYIRRTTLDDVPQLKGV